MSEELNIAISHLKYIAIDESDNYIINTSNFNSVDSLIGYDYIFMNHSYIMNEFKNKLNFNSGGLIEICQYKKQDIQHLINVGATFIIYNLENQFEQYDELFYQLFDFEIVHDYSTGKNIDFLDVNLKKMYSDLTTKYTGIITSNGCKALARVSTTNNCVSLYFSIGKSKILILPFFYIDWITRVKVSEDLLNLLDSLPYFNYKDFNPPKWTEKYYLPNEKSKIEEVLKYEEELQLLQDKIEEGKGEIRKIQMDKILFALKGEVLNSQVDKIFEELGFKIIEQEESNRTDTILEYNNTYLVVEVKGTKGSAKEKNAAQLEKWVSGYYADNDIKPKGVLVVNGFSETELNERTEKIFPEQMMEYSNLRKFCLISSLQLLGIAIEIRNSPEKKEEIANKIISTIGVFEGFENWRDFLEIDEE